MDAIGDQAMDANMLWLLGTCTLALAVEFGVQSEMQLAVNTQLYIHSSVTE